MPPTGYLKRTYSFANFLHWSVCNVIQVVSLQKEVERLKSALQEQQQLAEQELLTLQVQANQANESAKVSFTQWKLTERICFNFCHQVTWRKIKWNGKGSKQFDKSSHISCFQSQAAQLIQSNEICRDLEKNLSEQSRSLLEKESEVSQSVFLNVTKRL